jgi:hypothetical protein
MRTITEVKIRHLTWVFVVLVVFVLLVGGLLYFQAEPAVQLIPAVQLSPTIQLSPTVSIPAAEEVSISSITSAAYTKSILSVQALARAKKLSGNATRVSVGVTPVFQNATGEYITIGGIMKKSVPVVCMCHALTCPHLHKDCKYIVEAAADGHRTVWGQSGTDEAVVIQRYRHIPDLSKNQRHNTDVYRIIRIMHEIGYDLIMLMDGDTSPCFKKMDSLIFAPDLLFDKCDSVLYGFGTSGLVLNTNRYTSEEFADMQKSDLQPDQFLGRNSHICLYHQNFFNHEDIGVLGHTFGKFTCEKHTFCKSGGKKDCGMHYFYDRWERNGVSFLNEKLVETTERKCACFA